MSCKYKWFMQILMTSTCPFDPLFIDIPDWRNTNCRESKMDHRYHRKCRGKILFHPIWGDTVAIGNRLKVNPEVFDIRTSQLYNVFIAVMFGFKQNILSLSNSLLLV